MNVFEKFLHFFARKKCVEAQGEDETRRQGKSKVKVGEVHYLLDMHYNVVHPAHLLQPLCIAVAMETRDMATASVQDIRLYSMYDLEDGSFLGSFYALKCDGVYYGNIVGSSQIIACKSEAFRFEETNELFVPLQNDGRNLFVLVCLYECKVAKLMAKYLKRFDTAMKYGETLQKFGGMPFEQAYALCQKILKS